MTDSRRVSFRPEVPELDRRLLLSLPGLIPAQVRAGYGLGTSPMFTISGKNYPADGNGQTIAIIDFGTDPYISGDADTFDKEVSTGTGAPSLYSAYGPSQSWLTIANNVPGEGLAPNASKDGAEETSLDVEWAHAIAPGAKIVLVETASAAPKDTYGAPNYSNGAINYARSFPNVSVVSMSFGLAEASGLSLAAEQSADAEFTSPVGHTPIAFVAGSGDSGGNPSTVNSNGRGGPSYPSASPNVLAVGGTTVYTDAYGNFQSESGWSNSGGGLSFEPEPTYQYSTQPTGRRAVPDVAYDAGTNVAIYDSFYEPGNIPIGGTSAGAPQWAALVAIADEGRTLLHKTTLDGPNQLLPTLYSSAMTADFHDMTTGNNGYYNAGTGYDLVTGRGTPIDSRVITDLTNLPGNWTSKGSPISTVPVTRLPNGANPLSIQGTIGDTPLPDAPVEKSSATTIEASKPVVSVDQASAVPLLIPQVVDSILEGWEEETPGSILGRPTSRHHA